MFKIRNPEETSGEMETAYARYLDEHKTKIPADLWNYFRTGFFHDGVISTIEIQNSAKIILHITCPNIVVKKETRNEFLNVKFRCVFEGIVQFSLEMPEGHGNECLQEGDSNLHYLYSEIDSIDQDSSMAGDDFHSIIIQTAPLGQFLSIVFSSCRVEAVEPVAFSLIQTNPLFEVP